MVLLVLGLSYSSNENLFTAAFHSTAVQSYHRINRTSSSKCMATPLWFVRKQRKHTSSNVYPALYSNSMLSEIAIFSQWTRYRLLTVKNTALLYPLPCTVCTSSHALHVLYSRCCARVTVLVLPCSCCCACDTVLALSSNRLCAWMLCSSFSASYTLAAPGIWVR